MKPLPKLYTNSHYPLTLIYKDKDGVPIDITGYTAKLVIRRSLYTTPEIEKTATIGGLDGEITFTVEPADTVDILEADVDAAKYLMGAVMTDTAGKTLTILQSQIEVRRNIVQS
ncbi:hypothetical protein IT774_07640 [Salinimonas marina]|uniref:Uncharacterized protein n=1 Tax=Salinimonas marina TaxID=2785918 RepID=A0A7S9HEK0_9ALTE|nr:hypothetical protein [Salinimonas marina]QPG06967.1 hypothetical protein IT774_07640 [Salinimonas marina]